jgi:hypothetical protein
MTHTTDDASTAGGGVLTPEGDSAVAAQTSNTHGGIMMFINSVGELTVYDAESGQQFKDDPGFHTLHDTELKINENGEPELYDTREHPSSLMVEHKKDGKPYREPVKRSNRHIDARVIYLWTYEGSHCNCVWSNGKHVAR